MSLEAMGLPPDATEAEVRTTYRLMASKRHPDKGGTSAEFQELQDWYKDALKEVGQVRQPKSLSDFFVPSCMSCMGKGYTLKGASNHRMRFTCHACGGSGRI